MSDAPQSGTKREVESNLSVGGTTEGPKHAIPNDTAAIQVSPDPAHNLPAAFAVAPVLALAPESPSEHDVPTTAMST
jgi:hypothetical protein